MQPAACNGGITAGQTVMLALNAPLQFGVGYRYYRAAFLGAINGNFGMDCLVVTGTTVTFVYSLTQLYLACEASIPTKHVFFEVSGMLLMFVTFGKFVEAYAKGMYKCFNHHYICYYYII
jgi:Cu+-exporting ATPase